MLSNSIKVLLVIAAAVVLGESFLQNHGVKQKAVRKSIVPDLTIGEEDLETPDLDQLAQVTSQLLRRQEEPCNVQSRFRTITGRCNNVLNPEWGEAGATMRRMIGNAYQDGVSSPRSLGGNAAPLPTARQVSVAAHGPNDATEGVTLMVMQWGQFLDHDFASTPLAIDSSTDCCTVTNDECFSIPVASDDGYFQGEKTCLNFIRSFRKDVTRGGVTTHEQINEITSFIDASNVYGSSQEELDQLRGPNGSLLQKNQGTDHFLPEGDADSCSNITGEWCFLAGDHRVNEQPALAAMHTIFMREHNRIAQILNRDTTWSADRIFEETRKIVGAMMQVITYNEFLPIILGNRLMRDNDLHESARYRYRSNLDPTIINAFATAAYRFGHSLIPEGITLGGAVIQFQDLFGRPTHVFNDMGGVCHALTIDQAMAMDRHFAESVTNRLFQTTERTGSDLVARNIQRGRDHGLPSFNEFRDRACGRGKLTNWRDLFDRDSTASTVYNNIDDVDLFTGGVAEDRQDGAIVGPTFACILIRQFAALKFGDRFFYLNEEGPQAFTRDQIDELKKVKLSKIVCQNNQNEDIQENVFRQISTGNQARPCANIDGINLGAWTGAGDGGNRPRPPRPRQ